jgi:hypothetical protein
VRNMKYLDTMSRSKFPSLVLTVSSCWYERIDGESTDRLDGAQLLEGPCFSTGALTLWKEGGEDCRRHGPVQLGNDKVVHVRRGGPVSDGGLVGEFHRDRDAPRSLCVPVQSLCIQAACTGRLSPKHSSSCAGSR